MQIYNVQISELGAIDKANLWIRSKAGISTTIFFACIVMLLLTATMVYDTVKGVRDLQSVSVIVAIVFSLFFEFASYIFAIRGDTTYSFIFATASVLLARGTFGNSSDFENVRFFNFSSWTDSYMSSWIMSLAAPIFIARQSHALANLMRLEDKALRKLIQEKPEKAAEIFGDEISMDFVGYESQKAETAVIMENVPTENEEQTLQPKTKFGLKNPFW